MGQVALGFRSLLIKLAVFVVMAALLAWALGGTLWPRPQSVQLPGVDFDGRQWHWRVEAGGAELQLRWSLLSREAGDEDERIESRGWRDGAGPIAGVGRLYFAGLAQDGGGWVLVSMDSGGRMSEHAMPDRLAVEQQLSRAAAGLPLQSAAVIARQRSMVLNPPGEPDSNSP